MTVFLCNNSNPLLKVFRSDCPESCDSAVEFNLCGTDGVTYNSRCLLDQANCDRPEDHIQLDHLGSCEEGSKLRAGETAASASEALEGTTYIFLRTYYVFTETKDVLVSLVYMLSVAKRNRREYCFFSLFYCPFRFSSLELRGP